MVISQSFSIINMNFLKNVAKRLACWASQWQNSLAQLQNTQALGF